MEMETVTRMGVQLQPYSLALLLTRKVCARRCFPPEQVLDHLCKGSRPKQLNPMCTGRCFVRP